MEHKTQNNPGSGVARIPKGVWALGFVSLFMDMSSELVHSLLPVFLVSTLGASALSLGLIEGFAEAAASIMKVFSGALSDALGKRKALTFLGYGVSALTKPLFAVAPAVGWVFGARVIDRLGKGIRGAPRDALVADLTPEARRGAAYGLRQALDTAGAVLGPLAAVVLMIVFMGDIRSVYWFAIIPAGISLLILLFAVREPKTKPKRDAGTARFALPELKKLGRAYWGIVAVGAVLMLARFSEAFLILRSENLGLGVAYVPFVLVILSLVYAASAYPAGVMFDRLNRRLLLAAGILTLVASDIVLALAETVGAGFAGIALWGLHMGLTQGLLSALVAGSAPVHLRGTAFGLFYLVGGFMMIGANVLAGALWDSLGPPSIFVAGAAIATLALVLVPVMPLAKR